MGQLEAPPLVLDCSSERALDVPEQLALDEAIGQRPAVDRDKLLTGARAFVVDRGRYQLLAGPAFALDEHGHVDVGEFPDRVEQIQHRCVPAHDSGARLLGLQPPAQADELSDVLENDDCEPLMLILDGRSAHKQDEILNLPADRQLNICPLPMHSHSGKRLECGLPHLAALARVRIATAFRTLSRMDASKGLAAALVYRCRVGNAERPFQQRVHRAHAPVPIHH